MTFEQALNTVNNINVSAAEVLEVARFVSLELHRLHADFVQKRAAIIAALLSNPAKDLIALENPRAGLLIRNLTNQASK